MYAHISNTASSTDMMMYKHHQQPIRLGVLLLGDFCVECIHLNVKSADSALHHHIKANTVCDVNHRCYLLRHLFGHSRISTFIKVYQQEIHMLFHKGWTIDLLIVAFYTKIIQRLVFGRTFMWNIWLFLTTVVHPHAIYFYMFAYAQQIKYAYNKINITICRCDK